MIPEFEFTEKDQEIFLIFLLGNNICMREQGCHVIIILLTRES